MKLDKATEILTDILRYVKPVDPPEEHDAIKLGLEALKRCKYIAEHTDRCAQVPLPGETPSADPPDPLPPTRFGILVAEHQRLSHLNYR